MTLLFAGCSTLPTDHRTYAPDGKQIIARKHKVEVQISRENTVWNVYYVNNGKKPKCVGTTWETMDLDGGVPNRLVYLNGDTTSYVGVFMEVPWQFDYITVMVEGSGYVKDFYVENPYKNRKDCLYPKGKKL